MFGRKADQAETDPAAADDQQRPSVGTANPAGSPTYSLDVGAEADAALDHALREREAGYGAEDLVDAEDAVAQDALDEGADAGDEQQDGQDYVLYAEVEPHLRELVALQQERGRLIDLLLYAADRVSSPAAADRLDDGLRRLGIESLRPDGEPFDPAHHEASATVETDDLTLHGVVAETETPGYSDNGRLVRPPIVTVYRARGPQ